MFYYQHHIGDFMKDTANLDDHQMVTYLRMIWEYYKSESPITGDYESIAFAMRSDEKTVRLLLNHFFKQSENGWLHNRCEREITEYHSKSEKARNSANARWKNKKTMRPQSDRNANASENNAIEPVFDANPRTQEPKNPIKKNTATIVACPESVSQEVWDSFVKQRKTKRAQITELVMSDIKKEADKSGWELERALKEIVIRNWQSFKAEWVDKSVSKTSAKQSKHNGFNSIDYAQGVNDDGSF